MNKSFEAMRGERGNKSAVVTNEFGHLWAQLLQRGALETYRSIGFCAIGDDEGSNAVAARLALFLGGRGKNVALVEASLRAPELSTMFEVTATPGLADLLSGQAGLRDVLRARVAKGIDLIPAGVSADAFWSFTSDRFEELQRELLADHDLALIDVPALTRAPEAALVVRGLDAVVLIVQAGRHRSEIVQKKVAYLRSLGTPFLGAMLLDIAYDLPGPLARMF